MVLHWFELVTALCAHHHDSVGKIIKILLITGGVALVLWFTQTRVSYSGICVNCLANAKGGETRILGVTLFPHISAIPNGDDQRSYGPLLPPVDPKIYEIVTGHACEHVFKRGGMGWCSFGMIACGSSPEKAAFISRIEALEALFRLFKRTEDRPLAKESLALIDTLLPADTDLKQALRMSRWEPESNTGKLTTFANLLNIVTATDEWLAINAYAKQDFQGESPFLQDSKFLTRGSLDPRPEVHRAALLTLMKLETPDQWFAIEQALDDPDQVVADAAGYAVVGHHKLALFGKMLRRNPPLSGKYYIADGLPDEDIRGLLTLDDRNVDELCFEAILKKHRFHFLEALVSKVNRRDSENARITIRKLLDGPDALGIEGDPWRRIKPMEAPVSELQDILQLGTAPSIKDKRKWQFLDAYKALAMRHDTTQWDVLHKTYLREVSRGINEYHAAVMGRALAELDVVRTEAFLKSEIKGEDHHHLTCAFAAMGLIASPAFVTPIQEFKNNMPKASPGNSYPPASLFNSNSPYYLKFLDYAMHRCSGIHLQTLQRGIDGQYAIVGN